MRTARLVTRAASLVVLLLPMVASAAIAQTPRRAANLPLAKTPPPAMEYAGLWRSDADPSVAITITDGTGSSLFVTCPGRFEATGFASVNLAVSLMRSPPWDRTANAAFDMGVLWLEHVDSHTLRARISADLHGAANREETWKLQLTPPAPPAGDARSEALPAFGEYVYVSELPEAVEKVSPVYPDAAREHGIDGQVLVQALVGADGLVKETRIIKSIPELDAAAVASVRQWRFKPALKNDTPTAVWVAVPVKFALH